MLANPFLFIEQLIFAFIGILGIGFLIGFHEFGHLVFCKLFNIKAPLFSIGMGPKIAQKKLGTTNYTLSALPLGGYVEIATEKKADETEVLFSRTPYWQKMLVISGGIAFNLLFAYTALSALLYFSPPASPLFYPRYATTTIKKVEVGSPAEKSGLQVGDTIGFINDEVATPQDIITTIQNNPGTPLKINIYRGTFPGNHYRVENALTLLPEQKEVNNKQIGFAGILLNQQKFSFLGAFQEGARLTWHIIVQTVKALKSVFLNGEVDKVGGPIMIVSETMKGARRGIGMFVMLLAILSINLALLNVIPIPILDGGQALFCTIEALLRRPLSEKIKNYIAYTCWIFFLLLIILLSFKDVTQIFWGK